MHNITDFFHYNYFLLAVSDAPLNLGRSPVNQCGATDFVCPICDSFTERVFDVREQNAVFVASIGPTGGSRGYASIAGIEWE